MRTEINGKIYVADSPKAILLRRALVFTKEKDMDDLDPETLDELAQFITDVFGAKFDINDVYEEKTTDEMKELIYNTIQFVLHGKVFENEEEEDEDKKK